MTLNTLEPRLLNFTALVPNYIRTTISVCLIPDGREGSSS